MDSQGLLGQEHCGASPYGQGPVCQVDCLVRQYQQIDWSPSQASLLNDTKDGMFAQQANCVGDY